MDLNENADSGYRDLAAAVIRQAYEATQVPRLIELHKELASLREQYAISRSRERRHRVSARIREVYSSIDIANKRARQHPAKEDHKWLMGEGETAHTLRTFAGVLGHTPQFYSSQLRRLVNQLNALKRGRGKR
jgi:hypothetical protein